MEKVRVFNKLIPTTDPTIVYALNMCTDYKLKHNSGRPTGLMGASYVKLGNTELDVLCLLKSDKFKGKMPLNCIIDHKQKVCVTFVPPTKLTRTEIEFAIGYARTDKEAENKAREFRKAIKNGIKFYRYRNEK